MAFNWRIGKGLTDGTGDYVASARIAGGYDEFLADDPLDALDRSVLKSVFPALDHSETVSIVDFGCGTGRCSLPLIARGYAVVGVDLSSHMLSRFSSKLKAQAADATAISRCSLVRSNLVELDGLGNATVDHGICMFSTLGMINGRDNRQAFLEHAARVIKPDGTLVVHAHNFWYQTRAAGGKKWLLKSLFDSARGRIELGDRYSNYRGIKGMFIHSFRANELNSALGKAGFNVERWYPVRSDSSGTNLSESAWHRSGMDMSAIGWVVVCRNL
ncbi:MAG: class I SAM-dependent methyltransferase [Planctomycetota bacterium]